MTQGGHNKYLFMAALRSRCGHSIFVLFLLLLLSSFFSRGSLEMQAQKNRHLRTIAQICLALSSQLRHILTIGKNLVKEQYLLHMSS